MKYDKLLLDYVNGNLNYRKERKLFSYMKSDAELRATMKQFCAVGLETMNASDMLPSGESTDKLFSTLGFENSRKKPKGLFYKFEDFFRSTPGLFTGLISSLVTAGIMLAIFLPGTEPVINNVTTGIDAGIIGSGHHRDGSISASATGYLNRPEYRIALVKTDTLIKYVYVNSDPDTVYIAGTEDFHQEILKSFQPSIFSRPIQNDNPEYTSLAKVQSNDIYLMDDVEYEGTSDLDIYVPIGLSIEVRGASYWNIPYALIEPEKYENFRNLGAAVFYELTDDIKIGAEVRQETFYQEYEDEIFAYFQQPNFITPGLAVRYSLFKIKNYYPFVQVSGGMNRAGAVVRPMLGFEFRPYSDVSFMAGFEYSYLYFKQGNRNFGAHKVGLNYGVSYRF